MLRPYIEKIMEGNSLTFSEMQEALQEIFSGTCPEQTVSFLTAMRMKGETSDELYSAVKFLKEKMTKVSYPEKVLDIVGTGGDGQNTVNISTGAAIVAASVGAKVAKHGNRSASSKCGSADIIEELGIKLSLSPDEVRDYLDHVGIAFLYAPLFHETLGVVSNVRKKLKLRTMFNLLGPLLNPLSASRLLIGVAKKSHLQPFADVLHSLGVEKALVVYGDPLDELSTLAPSQAIEVTREGMKNLIIDPKNFGFEYGSLADLQGGDTKQNARLLKEALGTSKGALSQTIALNAGAGLYVYGLADSINEGVQLALRAMEEGKAGKFLSKWREFELCKQS